jgi:hypothetical protein
VEHPNFDEWDHVIGLGHVVEIGYFNEQVNLQSPNKA